LFKNLDYSSSDTLWYVLFAANGKAEKIKPYLENVAIEYFFPLYYREEKIRGTERYRRVLHPLLGNLIFVKSSQNVLNPLLNEVKLRLNISSDLYYRDFADKKIIVVPEYQMLNFIAVAGNEKEQVIYLSNDEVRLRRGTRVRIIGGVFEGVEGMFMRIRGDKRLVVSINNLFSVATAFVPAHFVQIIE
jgi:transcription antitermination factor NusG